MQRPFHPSYRLPSLQNAERQNGLKTDGYAVCVCVCGAEEAGGLAGWEITASGCSTDYSASLLSEPLGANLPQISRSITY